MLAGGWWLVGPQARERPRVIPTPSYQVVVADPYATPLLSDYGRYRDALLERDTAALAGLAAEAEGYLAYRAALTLARSADLTPAERLPFYRRALELRLDDPLARRETREFHLEMARTAEAAGNLAVAKEAYAEALPEPAAIEALKRLEDDPYRLANTFFKARQYRNALAALDGRAAPSIEAPSYRQLGEHASALEAYERWLAEDPNSQDARFGVAWSHFYLGNDELADALFAELPGSNAAYGRALLANRRGEITRAVELLGESGEPAHLWLASSLLEARDRYREALPVYLRLARGDSVYADDSAYRALVLAERLGDAEAAETARGLLPPDSFFALRLGSEPGRPTANDLERPELPVIELAKALARLNDLDAATGELLFALRGAGNEAEAVTLAETLQAFGEYRQSRLAAQRYLDAGSGQLRTWRAAYPRAFGEVVETAAAAHGVEPELVWAVMRQESAFYPDAVSVSDARGLMQVIPSTWNWLAELQREAPADMFDPSDNIRYGTFYLRWLLDYLDGDFELAVSSYNRGQGYIRRLFEGEVVAGDKDEFYREIDALETREYLQRVVENYHRYQLLYGPEAEALADAGREHGAD